MVCVLIVSMLSLTKFYHIIPWKFVKLQLRMFIDKNGNIIHDKGDWPVICGLPNNVMIFYDYTDTIESP